MMRYDDPLLLPLVDFSVEELSEHLPRLDPERQHSQVIYDHFLFPFLLNHNDTGEPVSGHSTPRPLAVRMTPEVTNKWGEHFPRKRDLQQWCLFLLAVDPHCVSSAEDSEEWLEDNFGFFSVFASLRELYQLNPSFAAVSHTHTHTHTHTHAHSHLIMIIIVILMRDNN